MKTINGVPQLEHAELLCSAPGPREMEINEKLRDYFSKRKCANYTHLMKIGLECARLGFSFIVDNDRIDPEQFSYAAFEAREG